MEPNSATAAPDPRATASPSRESENKLQPAACSGEFRRTTASTGSPASMREGRIMTSIIAFAVPRASLPMRNTTAFPPFNTPVASANTFGRPSNTKPNTPSGATRCSTDQPTCSVRDATESRDIGASRHINKAAIMSRLIFSESTSRVTERPLARADSSSR